VPALFEDGVADLAHRRDAFLPVERDDDEGADEPATQGAVVAERKAISRKRYTPADRTTFSVMAMSGTWMSMGDSSVWRAPSGVTPTGRSLATRRRPHKDGGAPAPFGRDA